MLGLFMITNVVNVVYVELGKMMSTLLMLVMLGVFIHSSQAVTCYQCIHCDEPTGVRCHGEICIKAKAEIAGVSTIHHVT